MSRQTPPVPGNDRELIGQGGDLWLPGTAIIRAAVHEDKPGPCRRARGDLESLRLNYPIAATYPHKRSCTDKWSCTGAQRASFGRVAQWRNRNRSRAARFVQIRGSGYSRRPAASSASFGSRKNSMRALFPTPRMVTHPFGIR